MPPGRVAESYVVRMNAAGQTDGWQALVAEAETLGTTSMAAVWADGRRANWAADDDPVAECMSVTKFVVGVVLGLAVDAGDLDHPLSEWIPEWAGDDRGAITLRQVSMHASGLQVLPATVVYEAESVEKLVLGLEPVEPPMTSFAYNNAAINLIGLVASRVAGASLADLAGERLFEPLGIEEWGWQKDPQGMPLCFAGLQLRARDLAAIGALFLTGGARDGKRLVPPEWIAAMPPPEPTEVGVCCLVDYEWVHRSEDRVDVGPRSGFGHSGDHGQYLTIQQGAGVSLARLRAEYDVVNPEAVWMSFPERVHEYLGPAGSLLR